jgi:hypothetical protein
MITGTHVLCTTGGFFGLYFKKNLIFLKKLNQSMITGTHVLVLQGKNQVNAGIGCQYGGRQRTAGPGGDVPRCRREAKAAVSASHVSHTACCVRNFPSPLH